MSPCLSSRALMRVVAGGGRPEQRHHAGTCARCLARRRAIDAAVDRATTVLLGTEPPPAWRPRLRRYWLPASATVAVFVVLLVVGEVRLWRAVTPPATPPSDVAAFLADVSATLFSLDPDGPGAAAADDGVDGAADETSACAADPLGLTCARGDDAGGLAGDDMSALDASANGEETQ